jgi:peptide/nickel transport system ATP-binding protein
VTEPLVRVENLSKVFEPRRGLLARLGAGGPPRVRAVADVSFDIHRGTTFALVGESGSGKSTIGRMVVGLLRPSAGRIVIEGTIAADAASVRPGPAMRRRLQMIFQDPYSSLNPAWRVDAIVGEPLRAFALVAGRREADIAVAELLEHVGLHSADARKYPHEFSGGQRQRIAIARALATRADILVCDEPTSALDVSVQAQILNLMRTLQAERGLTYLFITHNLAVVRFMADEVGVLRRGELVECGPCAAILDAPQHAYTRELVAAVPSIDDAVLAAPPRAQTA